jgi:hypothetical protein
MLYVADTHTLFAIPLARVFDPGARFRRFPLGPGVIGGLGASTPDGIWLGTYPWREMDSNPRSLSRKRKPESPSDRFDGSFFCGTDNSNPAFSAGEPSVPANLVRRGLAHYAG